jgi:hypothetical protein
MTHIKMTETEAMAELVGRLAVVTTPTATGTETVVGRVTTPLVIEEIEGEEVITHATVEGMMVAETITGLPLPIETERPARLEMVPVGMVELR